METALAGEQAVVDWKQHWQMIIKQWQQHKQLTTIQQQWQQRRQQ